MGGWEKRVTPQTIRLARVLECRGRIQMALQVQQEVARRLEGTDVDPYQRGELDGLLKGLTEALTVVDETFKLVE